MFTHFLFFLTDIAYVISYIILFCADLTCYCIYTLLMCVLKFLTFETLIMWFIICVFYCMYSCFCYYYLSSQSLLYFFLSDKWSYCRGMYFVLSVLLCWQSDWFCDKFYSFVKQFYFFFQHFQPLCCVKHRCKKFV